MQCGILSKFKKAQAVQLMSHIQLTPTHSGVKLSPGVFTLNSTFPTTLYTRLASQVGLRYQGRTRCMADSRRSADKVL